MVLCSEPRMYGINPYQSGPNLSCLYRFASLFPVRVRLRDCWSLCSLESIHQDKVGRLIVDGVVNGNDWYKGRVTTHY